MKKILFILTLMISFSSIAQDDTIKRFRFKASDSSSFQDRNHLFSEDFVHCSGNLVEAGDVDTFTWNAGTGFLSFNGTPQGSSITGRRATGLSNLFAGSYNEVNVTSSRGGSTQRLIYNEATNSWD